MQNYDLLVIGGGPAGTPVVMEYAKLNPDKKVLLVDTLGELGGECLFDGCIPSKIMQISARYINELKKFKEFGIELNDSNYKLAWGKIVQRKETILAKRTDAAKDVLSTYQNAKLIKASAKFLDKSTLEISLEDNTTESISFNKCVIATGSMANMLTFAGNANDKIWSNEDFFDKMQFPESMSIIGSGAIAIEFAQILSSLGCKITLFSRSNTILKNIDNDASSYLLEIMKNSENIELVLNAQIKEINFDTEFEISYTQGSDDEKIIKSQKVLSAVGRVPNIDKLNLDLAGVELDKFGIKTDKHLQTSNKNIYANGDVVSHFPKFAHTAQYGAHTIAQNLFLEHNLFSVDFDKNSWVLFSEPNIAMAGISEDQAIKKGLDVIVDKYEYSIDAKAQIEGNDTGYLKFVVDKKTNVIIGITILAYEANYIAGEAALIVANSLKLSDLISSIHPHPTLSESFVVLAKMMMGKIMQEKLKSPLVKTLLNIERFI